MENIMDKPFIITSVCRDDLLEIIDNNKALNISDCVMKRLASKMADAYCDSTFWIDLEIIIKNLLEEE